MRVESYVLPDFGPFPDDVPLRNNIRFTPRQIESISSGAREVWKSDMSFNFFFFLFLFFSISL